MTYLIFDANPWYLVVLLLLVFSLAIELPYRYAQSIAGSMEKNRDAFNAAQAGLLTLASFVLGLSFSQAQSRFDGRRALVVNEANAIGTTWLRAAQLPPTESRQFRRVLTDYTATRLAAYQTPDAAAKVKGVPIYQDSLDRSTEAQDQMWAMASSAENAHPSNLGLALLVQSLNDTIDVSAEQLQALTSHVPTPIVMLTLVLITLGALSLGLRFAADKSRPVLLSALYVVANVVVISMMVDYDRPQTGIVNVNLNPIRIQLKSMQQSP